MIGARISKLEAEQERRHLVAEAEMLAGRIKDAKEVLADCLPSLRAAPSRYQLTVIQRIERAIAILSGDRGALQ